MTFSRRPPRPIRNAVRDARDRRRSPGRRQHPPEIDRAAAARRALRRRLAGALGAADPRQDLSRRSRQRRCAVDDRHVPGRVEAGALGRRLDSRARPERRASAGDPVRQQRRARAVRAGGPACRRALGGDLAGLFADVQGFRQAQEHDRLLEPGAIYVSGTKPFAAALAAIKPLHSANDRQRQRRRMPTRFHSAPSRQRRKRRMLQKRSRR